MQRLHRAASLLAGLALLAALGCASTQVTAVHAPMQDEAIPRPDRIIVHDFAATPDAVPADSSLAGEVEPPSEPMTAEQLEAGRELGAAVATELVNQINEMGLNAVRPDGQPSPRPGDVLLRGYFLSIDEGSTLKRVVIGFGSGSAELKTVMEAYLMTERGLRRMGSGDIDSGGGKMPGLVLPLAVTLATANPIGLIVGGTMRVVGEVSGRDKIEGAGKRTAQEIAKELRPRLEQRGWIEKE